MFGLSALRASFVAALAVTLLAATPSPGPSVAPSAPLDRLLDSDVTETYNLLLHSAYKPVAQQVLLDGARASMASTAQEHGTATVPAFTAADNTGDSIAQLERAIVSLSEQEHVDQSVFAYAAMSGMAGAMGDKYTAFFDPKQLTSFRDVLDPQKIAGIGVQLGSDPSGAIMLNYVFPDTPADKAGLQPGDIVQAIDGKSTKGMSGDDAAKLMRGRAGETVHLIVSRDNVAPHEVDLLRSDYTPPTVFSKMLDGSVGYIWVRVFGENTGAEFDTALARLRSQSAKAIVLDVRNDGGGYVASAIHIASRFVARKPVFIVEQRGLPADAIGPLDAQEVVDVPVTVLVNQYTASASEITAGALQDDLDAPLVGTKTFGKGVMQTLTELADGSGIKITTAHYLTPSRRDINLKGIEPDVVVDAGHNVRFGDEAHDAQLRAAVALLDKKIAIATPR